MKLNLRQATIAVGALFTFIGVGWLIDPLRSAAALGMPLLDGAGRSTQIGDFSAFFLTAGITILVGSMPGRSKILLVPGALIGGAAITRTLAWSLHGASFTPVFIAVEAITGLLLLAAAFQLDE